MGQGIDWMIAVALWVAHLPGAVGRIAAFGTGPLLLCTAGLIILCLLRTPLRFAGAGVILLAGLWAIRSPLPDILVSHDGRIVAARNAGGRLAVIKQANDDFTLREWLAADGDARTARDPTLANGTLCDETGCVARLPGNRLVALAFHPEALEEDCRRAAIVVTARNAPASCAETLIDRNLSREAGALALRWNGASFDMMRARPPNYDRPWARSSSSGSGESGERVPPSRARPRDATPRPEDLEAGD